METAKAMRYCRPCSGVAADTSMDKGAIVQVKQRCARYHVPYFHNITTELPGENCEGTGATNFRRTFSSRSIGEFADDMSLDPGNEYGVRGSLTGVQLHAFGYASRSLVWGAIQQRFRCLGGSLACFVNKFVCRGGETVGIRYYPEGIITCA